MSSRRRAPLDQPRKEFAVYKKILSSDDQENDAPEYIRVPVEKAEKQAVKAPRGAAVRSSTPQTPRRRGRSVLPRTPPRDEEEEDSLPSFPAQTPRRRGSAPQRRSQLPRTPPRDEDDAPSSLLQTPSYRRRASTPAPRRSVTPNVRRGKESTPVEDGRGSPEERRRKSRLARALPRRPDGKFAPKGYDPMQEYYSGKETDDESGRESFRGNPNYSSKKKVAPAPTPRAQRRRAPKIVEVSDNEGSDDESSFDLERVVVLPEKNAPKEVVPSIAGGSIANNFSRPPQDRGPSYALQANRDINFHFDVTTISDSSLSAASVSQSIDLDIDED